MSGKKGRSGHFSDYRTETGEAICDRLAAGESIGQICPPGSSPSAKTVFRWLEAHEDFRVMYERARLMQAEHEAHEIKAIADAPALMIEDDKGRMRIDPADAQMRKVRINVRQWRAQNLAPRVYGAKVAVSGPAGGPLTVEIVRFGEDPPAE